MPLIRKAKARLVLFFAIIPWACKIRCANEDRCILPVPNDGPCSTSMLQRHYGLYAHYVATFAAQPPVLSTHQARFLFMRICLYTCPTVVSIPDGPRVPREEILDFSSTDPGQGHQGASLLNNIRNDSVVYRTM